MYDAIVVGGRVATGARRSLETEMSEEQGYAGSFFVFGHGTCYGEEGHCEPARRFSDEFDVRGPHPLEPWTRTVIVTEMLRAVTEETVLVTVVAVDHGGEDARESDVLEFESVRLVLYEE